MNTLWTDRLNLGDEKADKEHQQCYGVLNRIDNKNKLGESKENIIELFKEFNQTIRHHFNDEAAMMENLSYSSLREHGMEHTHLLEMLKSKLFEYESDLTTCDDILEFVVDWFFLHISMQDKQFHKFLASQ